MRYADSEASESDGPGDVAVEWQPYDRDCPLYLDSMVEGLSEEKRRKEATNFPTEGMRQIKMHEESRRLTEGPKSHRLANVLAFLNRGIEKVKALFAGEGADDAHIRPGYYFFCDDGNYLVDLRGDFDPGKGTLKALCRKFVRDFASEHDAYASPSWPTHGSPARSITTGRATTPSVKKPLGST